MNTNFQSPNLQREIIRKKITFFQFSPINLLIILYQLTKFAAHSCYSFRNIMITNFQSSNLQREIIQKKKITFSFKFSQIDLLIFLYQQTNFEAPICYSFRDIMKSKSAKGDNSKKNNFFSIFTNKSTHHPLPADQVCSS